MSWVDDVQMGWEALHWHGEVQWFAKKDGRPRGGRLRSVDALVDTVRNAEALGWDLYLNVNPTKPSGAKTKLSRSDVTHWRHIVVDLDPTGDALEPPQPEVTPSSHLLLRAHRIFSGRGYQFWLPVAGPGDWCVGDFSEFMDQAERITQGYLRQLVTDSMLWCPGWKVDTTCSDLPRVVRCPGSVNQRTGKRAVFEKMATSCVAVEHLQPYALLVPLPADVVKPVGGISNLLDLLPHLNVRARTFVLEGAESPGRHSACYATCKNMQELGVSASDALDWLVWGARMCMLPFRDVEKIVKQVYKEDR